MVGFDHGCLITFVNILLIATGFAPHAFSENIVNSKLVLAFLDNGWRVRIVSRSDEGPAYKREWQPVWSDLRKITHEVTYPTGGFVRRLLDTGYSSALLGHPIPGVRWARRALDQARRLHQIDPFDFVISRSPCDVGHLVALAFSTETAVPWIANWNDPPRHLWPAPYTHRIGKVARYFSHSLLKNVRDHSRVFTVPNSRLAEHICKSLRRRPRKVEIIPHVGLATFAPTIHSENDTFRLCHAGNLSGERDPGALLHGLAIFLAQERPQHKVEFEIIGVNHPDTLKSATANGVGRLVTITGSMGFTEVLNKLSQASVLVLLEAPCGEGIFLPSKLVDYVQVGRPLLCISPRVGTVHDLLTETKTGVFADCTNPMKIAGAIARLYRAWRCGTISAEYNPEKLWERFKPSSIVRQYEQIFEEITG